MGNINLATVSNGEIPTEEKWNKFKIAFCEDLLTRDTSGVPDNEAASLGDATYRWDVLYSNKLITDAMTLNESVQTSSADFSNGEYIYNQYGSLAFSNGSYSLLGSFTITNTDRPIIVCATIRPVLSNLTAKISVSTSTLTLSEFQNNIKTLATVSKVPTSYINPYSPCGTIITLPSGTNTIYLYEGSTTACNGYVYIYIREMR